VDDRLIVTIIRIAARRAVYRNIWPTITTDAP
jgi:hypothetical protein